MIKKYRYKCEYCGNESKYKICGTCCVKLKLIRFLQQMVRDTFERCKND